MRRTAQTRSLRRVQSGDEIWLRHRPAAVNVRNSVAIVLLVAAAAASYWWGREPPADPERDRFGLETALPGYTLHGARFTWTDALGRLAYRIHTDSLEELPDAQGLELSGVRVEYTPADDVPWVISAARGHAPLDRSRLDLEGEVEVRNQPADGEAPRVIEAASLRLTPGDSRVESDQAVKIRLGDFRLSGVGLRAHLKDDTLELESDVNGQVVP